MDQADLASQEQRLEVRGTGHRACFTGTAMARSRSILGSALFRSSALMTVSSLALMLTASSVQAEGGLGGQSEGGGLGGKDTPIGAGGGPRDAWGGGGGGGAGSTAGGAGGPGGGRGGGAGGTGGMHGYVGPDLPGGVQAGAIQFTGAANSLSLGSTAVLTGNIDVVGSLTLYQASDYTLSNIITGSGQVTNLDEALGLALGFRRVWSRADVPDPGQPQRLTQQPCDGTRPIVSHHPLNSDAPCSESVQRPHQEGRGQAAGVGHPMKCSIIWRLDKRGACRRGCWLQQTPIQGRYKARLEVLSVMKRQSHCRGAVIRARGK